MTDPFNYGAYPRGKFNYGAYPNAPSGRVVAWADRPAPADVAGEVWRFTDVGRANFGSFWLSDGTRWVPITGELQLASLGSPSAAIGNTETIVLQALLPAAGLLSPWQNTDRIIASIAAKKSGGTDAGTIRLRVGSLGTVSDALVKGINAIGATGLSFGAMFEMKRHSTTQVIFTGAAGGTGGSYGGSSTSASGGAITVDNINQNPTYITLSVLSAGATDTVTVETADMKLIAGA